jgi:hypothetical protein
VTALQNMGRNSTGGGPPRRGVNAIDVSGGYLDAHLGSSGGIYRAKASPSTSKRQFDAANGGAFPVDTWALLWVGSRVSPPGSTFVSWEN